MIRKTILMAALVLLGGCPGQSRRPAVERPAPTVGSIAAADLAIAATPYLAGNAVRRSCDCQAGAAGGCVGGDDVTGDGSAARPYRTLDAAMAWLNGGAGRTAALCQGGAFDSASTGQFVYTLASNACPAGTICNELREYPVGGPGPKPLIVNAPGNRYLFSSNPYNTNTGGWRFMNLKLQGSWDPVGHGNLAFFLYASPGYATHDVAIENVDMDGFDLAIQDATSDHQRVLVTGNHFTRSKYWAFLGASSDLTVSYNSFVDCGSDNEFDHAIYLASRTAVTNVALVGNYVSGFSTGSGNTNCQGAPIVGHGAFQGLEVSGNVVMEDASADPGCWGLAFTNLTGAPEAIFLRNARFRGNVIVNGGNAGLVVDNCPGCLIENNLVIQEAALGGWGIVSPSDPARAAAGDDVEDGARIVNNTVYFGVRAVSGMSGGVGVVAEGAGHVVANNTVTYAATTGTGNPVACFAYPLPLASYAGIDHNHCSAAAAGSVWQGRGGANVLPAWQATGFDLHASTASPGWPFSTPLALPAWDDARTGAELFAPYFRPAGPPLVGGGDAVLAPATDLGGAPRPRPPSIGCFEH